MPCVCRMRVVLKLALLCSLTAAAGQAPTPQEPSRPRTEPPGAPAMQKYVEEIRQRIVGRENEPAAQVFKNIEVLKDIPAGRVLPIMQTGFSASLGVDCSHCHTLGEWEKDDKEPKVVARKMWSFMFETNARLRLIRKEAAVNCTTCHRGEKKPALVLAPR